jgi:hypothetical protein
MYGKQQQGRNEAKRLKSSEQSRLDKESLEGALESNKIRCGMGKLIYPWKKLQRTTPPLIRQWRMQVL